MAIVLTIDGTPYEPDAQTFKVNTTAYARHRCTFDLTFEDASLVPVLRRKQVIATENGNRIFGGHVRTWHLGGRVGKPITAVTVSVDCVDFNALADRRVVTLTLPAGTLKSQLQIVIAFLASNGVTLDAGQVDGPTMPAFDVVDRMVTDLLDDLVRIAGYMGRIDYHKVYKASPPGSDVAPIDIETGDGSNYEDITTEPAEEIDGVNRVVVFAGGNTSRRFTLSRVDNNDPETAKHYGPGTPFGGYRVWNLSPLIADIIWGTAGDGSIKIVADPLVLGLFPQSLAPYGGLDPDNAYPGPARYSIERTHDLLDWEPFGCWPLNENAGSAVAGDAGSGGNDGTVVGSPVRDALGIVFDGVNDRIDLTGQTAFSQNWTWEGSVAPDPTQADTVGLLFGIQANGHGVRYNKTTAKIEVADGGGVLAQSAILTGAFDKRRIVVDVTAGAIKIYAAGVLDGTGSGWTSTGTPDGIGGNAANTFSFKGTLRDIAYLPGDTFTAEEVFTHISRPIDRLLQAVSQAELDPDGYLAIEYYGLYPIRVQADNLADQLANGLWEIVLYQDAILSEPAAQAYADQRLAEYVDGAELATYLTFEPGVIAGQTHDMNVPERNAVGTYLNVETDVEDLGGPELGRYVKSVGGLLPGSWLDWWKRRSSSGGSGSGSTTVTTPIGSSSNAAGPEGAVQFKKNGVFAGSTFFTFNDAVGDLYLERDMLIGRDLAVIRDLAVGRYLAVAERGAIGAAILPQALLEIGGNQNATASIGLFGILLEPTLHAAGAVTHAVGTAVWHTVSTPGGGSPYSLFSHVALDISYSLDVNGTDDIGQTIGINIVDSGDGAIDNYGLFISHHDAGTGDNAAIWARGPNRFDGQTFIRSGGGNYATGTPSLWQIWDTDASVDRTFITAAPGAIPAMTFEEPAGGTFLVGTEALPVSQLVGRLLSVRGLSPDSVGSGTSVYMYGYGAPTAGHDYCAIDIEPGADGAVTVPSGRQAQGLYLYPSWTAAASGTHPQLANVYFDIGNWTAGAASVTEGINVYIAGAPTLGTNKYALKVAQDASYFGGPIDGAEISAPAAPAANGFRMFAQDNGGGKTQLMVRFGSGAAQQIAIEP